MFLGPPRRNFYGFYFNLWHFLTRQDHEIWSGVYFSMSRITTGINILTLETSDKQTKK